MKVSVLIWLCFLNIVAAQNISFEAAKKLFQEGKLKESEMVIQTLLQKSPDNLNAKELLGDIAASREDWNAATEIFRGLIKLKPGNANYHFKYGGSLGMAALEMPKIKAAFYIDEIENHLLKAAFLDPQHIETRWALVKLYLQLPNLLGGSIATAEKYADELLKISKVDGYLAKAHISEMEYNLQATEKYLLKAVQVGQSQHTYEKLAHFFKTKKNNYAKAIEINEEAFSKLKIPVFALEIAEISAKHKISIDKGVNFADIYLQNVENDHGAAQEQAFLAKAQIFYFQNKKKEALASVNQVLELNPNNREALQLKKKIIE